MAVLVIRDIHKVVLHTQKTDHSM